MTRKTMLMLMAIMMLQGPGGDGVPSWLEDYVQIKDDAALDMEGELLDIPLDAEGE